MVASDDVTKLLARIESAPLAATALAVLLRGIERVDVETALAMESAVYSLLQDGPEFTAWHGGQLPDLQLDNGPTVETDRHGETLTICLNRPRRHNAITAQLHDELAAALSIAVIDRDITAVVLRGNGPSFCSGGDLAEFGARSDPASAHRIRLGRSPARLLHTLRASTTVDIHGATLGGGIEMAAFAGHVRADPATTIGLPEIELGLIPGAGGTVSLTHRIGRQRTAALALTGRRIDSRTALSWGLVDESHRSGRTSDHASLRPSHRGAQNVHRTGDYGTVRGDTTHRPARNRQIRGHSTDGSSLRGRSPSNLNPSDPQGSCGFESHPGHRLAGAMQSASGARGLVVHPMCTEGAQVGAQTSTPGARAAYP